MSDSAANKASNPTVLSLAQLLAQQPAATPCLVEPGLLPAQGILFVGGEPKVGKSLLVANLALSLAAGSDHTGFPIAMARRVLICQFELPLPQFSAACASCVVGWGHRPTSICWSISVPLAICSVPRRA
jgi:hypothetical protein